MDTVVMEKLDKVIRALECCLDSFEACKDCYLNDYDGCRDQLNLDALEVIRGLQTKYATALEMAATATELAAKYRRTDGDLISRAALIEEFEWLKSQVSACSVCEVEEHIERIRRAPAVEAEPVVHAHWVKMTPDQRPFLSPNYTHVCSKCGAGGYKHYRRCYDCGGVMDEVVFEPTPLWKLPLSTRIRKRLKQMGVTTVEQLEAMDKRTLYNTPGLGKASILEIESELRIWNNEKEKNNELLERQISE